MGPEGYTSVFSVIDEHKKSIVLSVFTMYIKGNAFYLLL